MCHLRKISHPLFSSFQPLTLLSFCISHTVYSLFHFFFFFSIVGWCYLAPFTWNLTRFDRLYQRQRGGLESSLYKHTHIRWHTHTLPFHLAGPLDLSWYLCKNDLPLSLDSSSTYTARSLTSHGKYPTRHPDHFSQNLFFNISFTCIIFWWNQPRLQHFWLNFKHIF